MTEQESDHLAQVARHIRRTRNLFLLGALSLLCASLAWIEDHDVFALVFAAFGTIAASHAVAWPRN